MAHWKEIGEKYNKLIKLLRKKGIIDEFEAVKLFTEDYILKKNRKIGDLNGIERKI